LICATCGRENPAHLTFCQDCGARLAPRVAPPTPPIGLHRDALAGAAPGDAPPRSGEPPKPRPSAPEFSFAPRVGSDPGAERAAEKPADKIACPSCGASNAPNLRFCNHCGTTLGAPPPRDSSPRPITAPLPAPSPQPAIAPGAAPAAPLGPKAQLIAPSPVVGIGAGAPLTTARICSRCRGACEPTAQFCKFCGASLVDSPITSSAPSAAAPSRPSSPASAQAAIAAIPAPSRPSSSPPIAPPTAPSFRPASSPPAAPSSPAVSASPSAQAPATAPDASRSTRSNSGPAALAASPSRAPAAARGRLVVITKDGAEGAAYTIVDQLDIGRDEGDVVVKDDRYLSPRHARITWRESERALYLRDLASVNGVFLRLQTRAASAGSTPSSPSQATPPQGQPQAAGYEAVLRDQDLILIGQQVIRFEVVKDAEEGLGPAVEHGTMVFGTPAGPRYARLCQRTVEGVTRDVYHVRKAETVLGRESGDIVFTEDPFLSRRHAAIRADASKRTFWLVDFGSSNGTFLQIRGEVALKSGDEFRVGQQLFRVVVG